MNPSMKSKQSAEVLKWTLDASNTIATGDTISSIEIKVFDSDETDVTSTLISGTPSFSGTDISVTVQSGTDGQTYNMRLRITTTNGEIIEDDMQIRIADVKL